jgi:hypothetical protein
LAAAAAMADDVFHHAQSAISNDKKQQGPKPTLHPGPPGRKSHTAVVAHKTTGKKI